MWIRLYGTIHQSSITSALVKTIEVGVAAEIVGTLILGAIESESKEGMVASRARGAVVFGKVAFEIISLNENGT